MIHETNKSKLKLYLCRLLAFFIDAKYRLYLYNSWNKASFLFLFGLIGYKTQLFEGKIV